MNSWGPRNLGEASWAHPSAVDIRPDCPFLSPFLRLSSSLIRCAVSYVRSKRKNSRYDIETKFLLNEDRKIEDIPIGILENSEDSEREFAEIRKWEYRR